jgi:hypothetical protein
MTAQKPRDLEHLTSTNSKRESSQIEVQFKSQAQAEASMFRWKPAWSRPLKIDERSLDPFTVARMTDHNVRGIDNEEK